MKLNDKKRALVEQLVDKFGNLVTRKQVLSYVKSTGLTIQDVRFIFNTRSLRAGRATYDLSSLVDGSESVAVENDSVQASA